MPPLDISEIRPGVVARLDTAALRGTGGSETNAQRTELEDRAVSGVHDFLVVGVDDATERCVAVPLFPKSAPGSAPLDPRRSRGGDDAWQGARVYYSRWQHWRIPLAALAAASASDPGAVGERRSYALGDLDALREIANWASYNRNAFREA